MTANFKPYRFLHWALLLELSTPYLGTSISDSQAKHTGHFAVVRKFEAGLSSFPNQDFVENKLILILHINPFSIAELLRRQMTAVDAHMVFLKDGGCV